MALRRLGLHPRIVRHPAYAVALLSTAKETDAMNDSDTYASYAVVESINDDTPLPNLNSLLGILKRMRAAKALMGCPGRRTMCQPVVA